MLWEHELQESVSKAFSSSAKPSRVFFKDYPRPCTNFVFLVCPVNYQPSFRPFSFILACMLCVWAIDRRVKIQSVFYSHANGLAI